MTRGQAAVMLSMTILLAACNMASSPAVENATTGMKDSGAQVVPAQQAVLQADLPGTDLDPMNEAEFAKVVEPGPYCSFAYTTSGNPVLVATPTPHGSVRGVIKLHGDLVEVTARNAMDLAGLARGTMLQADGIGIAVQPREKADRLDNGVTRREADLLFRLKQGLEVGYGGFYTCAEQGLPSVE